MCTMSLKQCVSFIFLKRFISEIDLIYCFVCCVIGQGLFILGAYYCYIRHLLLLH